VMGGEVIFAGWHGALGWTVVVENQNALTIYGHLCCGDTWEQGVSSIRVAEGMIVSAGDELGAVGSTGNSSGAHLHLEVQRCDPESGSCQAQDPDAVRLPGQTGDCHWGSAAQFSNWKACHHWEGWSLP
jgi:murein DD-endopeptidase MepM/ murein hydrolase activator NlpD